MISNIFGKRKPVNYILIATYLFLYVMAGRYFLSDTALSLPAIASTAWIFTLLMVTAFGTDLLDSRHSLSGKNAYVMFLFATSLGLFPKMLTSENIVIAHIFILMAINRLFGLSNETNTKQKIFDAALWTTVAALFYSWAVLYFTVVYMAIVLYTPKKYKNWSIPLIAVMAMLILRYTYFLWLENDSGILDVFQFTIQWEYLTYSPSNYFLPFVFLAVMGFIATFTYGIRAVKKRAMQQSKGFLIITSLLIGTSMVLFFGDEHKTSLLFIMFPVSVLFANYLNRIKKKWIKESFLWLFLLAPLAILMLQFAAVR